MHVIVMPLDVITYHVMMLNDYVLVFYMISDEKRAFEELSLTKEMSSNNIWFHGTGHQCSFISITNTKCHNLFFIPVWPNMNCLLSSCNTTNDNERNKDNLCFNQSRTHSVARTKWPSDGQSKQNVKLHVPCFVWYTNKGYKILFHNVSVRQTSNRGNTSIIMMDI